MGTRSYGAADFYEMALHGMGVGEWHHQSGTGSLGRADGAEDVGILVAKILDLTGSRAFPRPLVDEAVLLANPGLVLEPDFDRDRGRKMGYRRSQRPGEVFLKSSIVSAFWPTCRGRAETWENPSSMSSLPTERSW